MKVGIVADVYKGATNGVVVSTQSMVKGLRERGHEVYIFSTGAEEGDAHYTSFEEMYLPFGKKIMKELKMPWAKPDDDKMKSVFKHLDIVHIIFPFKLGTSALKLALEMNIPVVSTFHIQAEHFFISLPFNTDFLTPFVYRSLLKRFYNKLSHVFFPSTLIAKTVDAYELVPSSSVLSNGISKVFQRKAVAKGSQYIDKFVIISIGRLTAEKSHKNLINAVSQSKNREKIKLLIFGEGPLKAQLIKQGKKRNIDLSIDCIGQEVLADIINQSDLYIHASRLETEGMAPLEASACGLPLLISDSKMSASRDFVLNDNFLFRHGDETDLTRKIDEFISSPDVLSEASPRYEAMANKYRIDKVIDALEKKYLELIHQSSR